MTKTATISLIAFLAGCSDGHTPSLTSLHFDGASPNSSLVLLLSTTFEDPDGDLAGCSAQVIQQQAASNEITACALDTFINEKPTDSPPLSLIPLFAQNDLADDATSGTVHFVLQLSFNGAPPTSGSTFTLGARVIDAAQNTSSTAETKLQLENE